MKKSKQVGWVVGITVLAIGGFIGVQALLQVGRMEGAAVEACHKYLEAETGKEIRISDLRTTPIETVFPEPLDKRFRTTCTYGGATVELEGRPFKPWTVVGTTGLD
jgi:hypothetical protein